MRYLREHCLLHKCSIFQWNQVYSLICCVFRSFILLAEAVEATKTHGYGNGGPHGRLNGKENNRDYGKFMYDHVFCQLTILQNLCGLETDEEFHVDPKKISFD